MVLGLLLVAAGGVGATAAGFEMLLGLAYGLWGLAFACLMGTALGSIVLLAGIHVVLGRMPAFMTYTLPVWTPGPPPVPAPPSPQSND